MTSKLLVVIDEPDFDSAMEQIPKFVLPEENNPSDKREGDPPTGNKRDATIMQFSRKDIHFLVQMEILKQVSIDFEALAECSGLNKCIIGGKNYVYLDDKLAELAARHCEPSS